MIRLRELGKKNDKMIWEMVAVHPLVFSRQGWFPHPRIMFIFWGETSKVQRIDLSEHRIWMYPWNPMVYFKIKQNGGCSPHLQTHSVVNICGGTTEPIIWLLTISVITPVVACRGTGRRQPRGPANFVNPWICGWKPRWTQTGDRCILVSCVRKHWILAKYIRIYYDTYTLRYSFKFKLWSKWKVYFAVWWQNQLDTSTISPWFHDQGTK